MVEIIRDYWYHGIYEGEPIGDAPVFCADEKTAVQALGPTQITICQPGHPNLVDNEYTRHGTTNIHAAKEIRGGLLFARTADESNMEEFRAFVKEVMATEPFCNEPLAFWLVDNGSCHHPSTFQKWLDEEFGGRVIAVFTPAHASWLNQAELIFSVLVRKILTPCNCSSVDALKAQIMGHVDEENEDPHPYNWQFTTTDLDNVMASWERRGLWPIPYSPWRIYGVGDTKLPILKSAFGQDRDLQTVSQEEIAALEGFGPKLSLRVWEHWQSTETITAE